MVAQYIIAPNPRWSALKVFGVPAANGYVFTYISGTRIKAATYLDPAGINQQTNPVRLNSAGEATIYWRVGSGIPLYTILVFSDSTVDGVPGQLIGSVNNYPNVAATGGGSVVTIYSNNDNYMRNAQFTFWTHGNSFLTADLIAGDTPIADAWFYRRDNTNSNVTISQKFFDPETNPPPGTASSYLEYECTSAMSSTVNAILQKFTSVQTLSNLEITVGFWARTRDASSTSTVSIVVQQYFGAGGSATPAANLYSQSITDEWAYYSTTLTVPSIAGKTIGTGGDDYLLLGYQFQTNQIIAIDIVDAAAQPELGTGVNFPYLTQNDQYNNILQDVLEGDSDEEGTNIIGWSEEQNLHDFLISSTGISNTAEFLIGWAFKTNPRQFGLSFPSISNNTYIADQTILLSDGNGVVSLSNSVGQPLILNALQTGNKFGIFTIIEAINSVYLQNISASLGARVGLTAGTSTFKMSVLGWSGTANLPTRNAVSSWNSSGSNPSLATNWAYASDVFSFTVEASDDPAFQSLNNQFLTTYSNYGVLVWNDSADVTVGTDVIFYEASLSISSVARFNAYVEFGASYRACQRYVSRSYDVGVSDGAVTGLNCPSFSPMSGFNPPTGGGASIYPTSSISATDLITSPEIFWVNFPVPMLFAPSVTVYSPQNLNLASTGWLYATATTGVLSGTNLITMQIASVSEAGVNVQSENGLLVYSTSTSVLMTPSIFFNYSAHALLGV